MSEAYRCDITELCIPVGESKNASWTIKAGTITVLGKAGVTVSLEVRVSVAGVEGPVHLSQMARDAITDKIKTYFANL